MEMPVTGAGRKAAPSRDEPASGNKTRVGGEAVQNSLKVCRIIFRLLREVCAQHWGENMSVLW